MDLANTIVLPNFTELAWKKGWQSARQEITDFLISEIQNRNIDNGEYPEVILDLRGERAVFDGMMEYLLTHSKIPKEHIVVLLSQVPDHNYDFGTRIQVDNEYMCTLYNFYDNLLQQKIDWENIALTKHCVVLSRRPTLFRAKLVKSLLELYPKHVMASFGVRTTTDTVTYPFFKEYLKPMEYPLSLDSSSIDETLNHTVPGDVIFQALAQVIPETTQYGESPFVTEKSFKVFAWHQLPIWYTSTGHVQIMRELGFDVFDDIFDGHQYDSAISEEEHFKSVMATIRNFIKKYPTLESVSQLRSDLWDRIKQNNHHLKIMIDRNTDKYHAV